MLLWAPPADAQDGAGDLLQRAAASRAKGSERAPVVVVEIADFQCPYCARFSTEVFPRLDSAFVAPGKVRWVFINLPLPNHRTAWVAAEAALCVGAVGNRFWPMHDRIFAAQQDWTSLADPGPVFAEYARELGVPFAAYQACVSADRVASLLLNDAISASSAGVTGTPTFVVDGEQKLVGLKSFEEWREVLEAALQKKQASGRRP